MAQELPLVPSVARYRVGTELAGVPYVLDLSWVARDRAWYADLYDVDASPIRRGIKVVLGCLLGRRCVDPRYPAGILVGVDTSGKGQEAGLDDLGTRVIVEFYPWAEVVA